MSKISSGILVAALLSLSLVGIASATTETCTASWKETLTTGSIVSGSANWLCYLDGTTYVLREASDNGVSKLRVKWKFENVPAGVQSIKFWGTRPNNSEGDNFQFYYNTTGQDFGQLISGAIINHAFAPQGGTTVSLGLTTTQPGDIYILMSDTSNTGNVLTDVTLDQVVISTQ